MSPDALARRVHDAFAAHQKAFLELTAEAIDRFAHRDWHGQQRDAGRRLDLFPEAVRELSGSLAGHADRALWHDTRERYRSIAGRAANAELARTFYNSVARRVFGTAGVDPDTEFIEAPGEIGSEVPADILHEHDPGSSGRDCVRAILAAHPLRASWAQADADVALAGNKLDAWLRNECGRAPITAAQTLRPVFYRNKGAYLVGRVRVGDAWRPLVLALVHGARGVEIDAVLTDSDDVSVLFSFARSYFFVATDRPGWLLPFLHSIMPLKSVAELYIALGFHKHGKAELYRGLRRHLDESNDHFEIAAGDKGMVMLVFALPARDLVFKVIRDRFAYPKKVTRKDVMSRYRLVFRHDRVGRLVDAQEFEQLRFPRNRFTPDLLDELRADAAANVEDDGVTLTFKHVYVERRVVPLNLYLRNAGHAEARHAILDYGRAIKQLAAANVFPGDFLLKNFGVTRHGRVVFYDYDELCSLSDCRFRRLPVARRDEDELSAEPWFSVADEDVFPEEFPRFLGLPSALKGAFEAHHADLFDVEFWLGMQRRHERGDLVDIYPYPLRRRLRPHGV